MSNALSMPTNAADIVEEYIEKAARVEAAIANYKQAHDDLNTATTVRGTYAGSVASEPHLHAKALQRNLLISGWRAVYNYLQIDRIASAADKQQFERGFADPIPLTLDNAKATFGDYFIRPRFHILRGMAEVFTGLDDAYKSHSKVSFGVKGLPKRVILYWGDSYAHGYGFDKFRDIVNALAAFREQELFDWTERNAIVDAHRSGRDAVLDGSDGTVARGLTIRLFKNGNAHVFFDEWAQLDINRALAEFYGEVLPDVDPDAPEKAPSTAVSKDLQFYWTPEDVAQAALNFAGVHDESDGISVLEPSCGEGHILDELAKRGAKSLGVEYHPGRAEIARGKGHAVTCANFLELSPSPEFDKIVMNPPFYGKHYAKHVRQAFKWLKPGGVLVAILPASARYDHNELHDIGRTNGHFDRWRDLPPASFAEAGTNVPTVLFKAVAPG